MSSFIQDVQFGVRMMLKKPGFTMIIILALAIGIGANTAIFSVTNAVLLTSLPYANTESLVALRESNVSKGIQDEAVSPATFLDWRNHNQSFVDLTAITGVFATVTLAGEPERLFAASVTPNYFTVLGAGPRLGRAFLPEEGEPGKNRVVILSSGFWERQCGANAEVLGTTITLNGNPYTIIGVMPPDFINARLDYKPPEMWFPMVLQNNGTTHQGRYLSVVARLKPGVSIERARADIGAIQAALEQQYPDTEAGWSATMIALREVFVGDVRPAIYALTGAVCLLLLIACANVSNLLLARTAARQKEIAIRLALGSGKWRIVRQLLTESALLALLGGGLGVFLAYWGLKLLVNLAPRSLPRLHDIGLDARVLLFTGAASLLSGVVFGIIPALHGAKQELSESLKEGGGQTSEKIASKRLRYALAATEIALSLMLLIGAGLLVKSFIRLQNVNLGFHSDRILTGLLALPPSRYRDDSRVQEFYGELVSRVEALPGVEAAAAANATPLAGGNLLISFDIEGRPQAANDEKPDADYRSITPGYFDVIGVPLLAGRSFNPYDNKESRRVVLINQAMAKRYWPERDPLGERIHFNDLTWEIIGVVGDIRNESLTTAPYPQVYVPYTQMTERSMVLVARTTAEPLALLPSVKGVLKEIDKEQPLSNITTLSQMVSDAVARPRFSTFLIGIFAVMATGLAALGVYGVISYSVVQRTHEIGVRLALGASPGHILRLVARQGMMVIITGVSAGLFGAFALSRLLSALLFGTAPTDAYIFAGSVFLIAAVVLLAIYVPARKASRLDPIASLK